ncbi:MAG: sensor histidine kinase [Sulfuricaulis sp.]
MFRNLTLRGLLLWYLLVPLGVLWTFNAMTAYYVAREFSNEAYDQALFDTTRTLAEQIRTHREEGVVDMPPMAWNVIYNNSEYDEVFFQVKWVDGAKIIGNADLAPPPVHLRMARKPIFYNSILRGKPIRVASLYVPVNLKSETRLILVQSAETLTKRKAMEGRIIYSAVLPQLILILLATLSVWFGVRRGLLPLQQVRHAIDNRSERDLSPLTEHSAPYEIRPLLHAMNELMRKLNVVHESQRRFVADAAHQLRTPLAGLIAQSEYAMRQVQPESESLGHAIEQIKFSAERANRLINQLLTLARSEASLTLPPAFELLDLNQLLWQVTAEWMHPAMHKNIDLGFDGHDRVMVRGNAVLLREMMANLLDNAIRYTPQGGRITVRLSNPTHPLIFVEDDGPGIPLDERERVFERFYRVLGNEAEGSGLGLAIVREISKVHGARVWITSGAGDHGTRVCVQFEHTV